ncbi:thermonuclease family protein [Desulfovibrio sp. X2]|uniref:thermonuclease family protein n=1 Tax=Desulfovibrio sp. X2 TaxID=941449 RepID=UPI000414B465|nr:thermonuclease family protein [Desulfovibrio sp. X2]
MRVRFVADGDTFVAADGRVVRLAGIDAPETGKHGAPSQAFAEAAAERLRGLVLGRAVEITLAGDGRDRHGRLLALVRLPDGQLAQELLVREGLAVVYPHPDNDPASVFRLLRLQREAIREGRGLWPSVLDAPANGGRWGGNRESRRFGPPDCPFVRQTAKKRRIAFKSLREAFWEGYAPYRECRSPFNLQN